MRLLLLAMFLSLPTNVVLAQLQSTNYQIDNYSVGTTEADNATSTNYEVEYANDGEFTYDATGSSGGSSGGGGEKIEWVDADGRVTNSYPVPPLAPEPTPEPEPESTPPPQPESPTPSQPSQTYAPPVSSNSASVGSSLAQSPQSELVPEQTVPLPAADNSGAQRDDVIELTYSPYTDGPIRGTFGNGVVGKLEVTDAVIASGTVFTITQFPLYDRVIPPDYRDAAADEYMYQIVARDARGRNLSDFGGPVKFSILYPGGTFVSNTVPYSLRSDRSGWEVLETYEVGSNVYSFTITSSKTVSVWKTGGEPTVLPIDVTSEPDSAPDSEVVTESVQTEGFVITDYIPQLPLWQWLGLLGALVVLIVVLLAMRILRRSRED